MPAVVARSVEEADRYRELLDDHDIPAILATDDELAHVGAGRSAITRGVPILVPEAMLDEASEIIADWEDFEEYQVRDEDDLGDEDYEAHGSTRTGIIG